MTERSKPKVNNIKKKIRFHPVYIYFSAVFFGMTIMLSSFTFIQKFWGLKIEKKGTYLYYQDYYSTIEENYVSRVLADNIILENKNLRESLLRNNTQNVNLLLDQIHILNIELEQKSKEMISYTTSISFSLDGSNRSINTQTEKYSILKKDIDSLREQITILYSKL